MESLRQKKQKFKGGRWRYHLIVSLKLAKSTMQRNKHSRVDVGVTNLQCPLILQSLAYNDTIFKGRRWRYKLTVSLKFVKSTIQRYKTLHNSRVEVGVTNLQCPWNLQSLPCQDTPIQGWTLALQTYGVLEICAGCHTKIQESKDGRWLYKLKGCLKFAKSTIPKTSRMPVAATNLQCNWNVQSLPYEDTKNQGWKLVALALQTYSVLEICKGYHTKIQKNQGWS